MLWPPQVLWREQVAREFDVGGIDAEAHRGVGRVGHVQVVGPGLGPVLPRMHAGVAAHETLRPVGRRALVVVLLQRGAVVGALVAEQRAEVLEPGRGPHQQVPVVVADLVAEVAHQRAVGLAHLGADALAHRVLGLLGIEGDDAGVVAGHHVRAARHVAQEVEGQAMHRIGMAAHHRQPQREQLRDQAPLGLLELAPEFVVAGHREIGNGARDAAGQAVAGREAVRVGRERLARARHRHHPVAGRGRHQVGAAAVGRALRIAEDRVAVGLGDGIAVGVLGRGGRERHHAEAVLHVAQRRVAGQAFAVAQEHGPAALAAVGARDGGRGELGGQGGRALGELGRRFVVRRGGRVIHGRLCVMSAEGRMRDSPGIVEPPSMRPAAQSPICL
ncbi:MAG: hypothetical protein GAK39_06368 [Variovorax sp.]|nr:MAG: hypothetical protein GAK39_06368 [Variovorax sp.]